MKRIICLLLVATSLLVATTPFDEHAP